MRTHTLMHPHTHAHTHTHAPTHACKHTHTDILTYPIHESVLDTVVGTFPGWEDNLGS